MAQNAIVQTRPKSVLSLNSRAFLPFIRRPSKLTHRSGEEDQKIKTLAFSMEVDEDRSDFEKEEEEYEDDDSVSDLLRDRFRLSAISIAEAEAKRNGMEISEPIVACIADLAFKYTGQLAKDLELFAQHAGRKSVKMEDVIISAHRNEHLAASLRFFHNELKAKEPQSERKRKKAARKDDKATASVLHSDL